MSNISELVRNGSHTSISSSGSSMDTSSHNHILNSIRSIPSLPPWLHESWAPINHRHERIAAGIASMGNAVLTREMIEMHIQDAPDIGGRFHFLPVAVAPDMGSRVRRKLGTWPLSKQEAMVAKQYAA